MQRSSVGPSAALRERSTQSASRRGDLGTTIARRSRPRGRFTGAGRAQQGEPPRTHDVAPALLRAELPGRHALPKSTDEFCRRGRSTSPYVIEPTNWRATMTNPAHAGRMLFVSIPVAD